MIPFAVLAYFAAHEEELLPYVQPLVTIQRAKIGKLLRFITRHAIEE